MKIDLTKFTKKQGLVLATKKGCGGGYRPRPCRPPQPPQLPQIP